MHAADRQHVGHLAALKMSSIQSMLNNNIHSAVTLTHLLLPGILKRCGSCGAGIEIDGGGGGGSSMNDHTYRPRPLAAVMSRLRKSRTPATAGVNNISKIYKLSTSEALSPEQPGGGRILFISSISSAGPSPCNSIYAASKAFLSSFAQVSKLYFLR